MADEQFIDGSFLSMIQSLGKTMIFKLEREARSGNSLEPFTIDDLAVLTRYSYYILANMTYLYKNVLEEADPFCLPEFGFTALSTVRVLIDCLYNVISLVERPENGRAFRVDGYRQLYESVDQALSVATEDQEVMTHLRKMRSHYETSELRDGLVNVEGSWPTLSQYLRQKPVDEKNSTNQQFLRQFSFGMWRQYSAISHGTFWGLTMVAPFFMRDRTIPEGRAQVVKDGLAQLTQHHLKAALTHLCLLTELQHVFDFHNDGARITERLREIWDLAGTYSEGRAVFESRYVRLLGR